MLSPYRVLDLSDERGQLCGQILGDLGADVILVEPPGGSPARRRGPFYQNQARPEYSLSFWAFNRNKRSITLDLERPDERDRFKQLVAGADFLVESADPGYLAGLGLGYSELSTLNPRLIQVSISAFGQSGPRAHQLATDLTMVAAGGPMMLQGDSDRPPLRLVVPQAWLHAAADGAAAALIAHSERVRSGLGQHIDVSAQEAVSLAAFSQPLVPMLHATPTQRMAGGARLGRMVARQVWPARDGYVVLVLWFGAALGAATGRLMQCIFEHGFCNRAILDHDWMSYDSRLLAGEVALEEFDELKLIVERFTRSLTKAELLNLALERALLIAPVATIEEVANSPQLAAREYFIPLYHPELGVQIKYAGPFARFSETPIGYRRRPPLIGEHNREILLEAKRPPPRPSRATVATGQRALEGLKIVDLFWAMAGPASTRTLADYGATVIRIESSRRLDTCRTIGPYLNNLAGVENSGLFINLNAGKLGLALDLGQEEGRRVFRDLVRWADIVTESFSPKAMRAWGLDYAALIQINPELIMVSSCLMGQTGPYAKFAGYGNLAAAMCGFGNLCGWADRPPAGPYGSYTDCVAPRFTVAAILAALDYRRRTGRGQYIELSQAEASMHFLAPALLDFSVNSKVTGPEGNCDPEFAPHGVYPCAGNDCWIAIACVSDQNWHALSRMLGDSMAGRFTTMTERLAERERLDAALAHWCRQFEASELEVRLLGAGIPASKVATSSDLHRDAQFQWREHYVLAPHRRHGMVPVERFAHRLSRTPARIERGSPILGDDSERVLQEFLGYSPERIAQLRGAHILE